MVDFSLNLSHVIVFILGIIITYFLVKKFSHPQAISQYDNHVVLDTSSLIDGRLLEVSRTGFITGVLYVPKFVLDELQQVADSPDSLKRNKGRRGLDTLKRLQRSRYFKVEISEIDFHDITEVDEKLIKLAKEKKAKLMTVDFNLNERAKIEGLTVLNINQLSNAIKPSYLPGEKIEVKVVQRGKERNQGVGYLADGTMVVVEEGEPYLDRTVEGTVSRIFQTDAGRMIFVKLPGAENRADTRKPSGWLPFFGGRRQNDRKYFRGRYNGKDRYRR
jgi:uncharacterized protein YacL